MKRFKLFFIATFLCNMLIMAQQTDPVSVVQEQLDAYNSVDLERFMEVFDDKIELYVLGNPNSVAKGKEQVKGIYKKLFDESPELHSVVINRTLIGNKVIDYERISGRKGSDDTVDLVMIYEVKDGKIIKAYSIR